MRCRDAARRAPGGANRLARVSQVLPFGDAIGEQVHDVLLSKIPARERLIQPQWFRRERRATLRQDTPAVMTRLPIVAGARYGINAPAESREALLRTIEDGLK